MKGTPDRRIVVGSVLALLGMLTVKSAATEVSFSASVRADLEAGPSNSPTAPPAYLLKADSPETAAQVAELLRSQVSELDYRDGRVVSFSATSIADVVNAVRSGRGAVTIDRMPVVELGEERRPTLVPFSKNARRTHNIPELSKAYGLSGRGIGVAIWDHGSVLATHVEFDDRVELRDPDQPPDDHATQVAGNISANGDPNKGGDPDAEGIAPASRVYSYFWKDDIRKLRKLAEADPAISITNHSYGDTRGWSFVPVQGLWGWYGDPRIDAMEDYKFGKYDQQSAEFDAIIAEYPRLSVFVAAGNNRNPKSYPKAVDEDWTGQHWLPLLRVGVRGPIRPPDRQHDGGYDTLLNLAVAKNVITIGAMEDIPAFKGLAAENVLVTAFSNWGPTDDGRIKPDLVANGSDLRAPAAVRQGMVYDRFAHANSDGTSMASPTAAGIAALLNELNIARHGKPLGGDEMKAVLVATAVSPDRGPNYRIGWGAIDALAAGSLVAGEAGRITSVTIESTRTEFKLARTTGPMSLTMAWIDPASPPNTGGLNDRTPTLSLDFDLELIDPTGTIHFPWSLDVDHPAFAATNAAANHRDNVERIDLYEEIEQTGNWLARITAPEAAMGHRAALAIRGFKVLD